MSDDKPSIISYCGAPLLEVKPRGDGTNEIIIAEGVERELLAEALVDCFRQAQWWESRAHEYLDQWKDGTSQICRLLQGG